jgi:hypothetical protein
MSRAPHFVVATEARYKSFRQLIGLQTIRIVGSTVPSFKAQRKLIASRLSKP